MQGHVFIERTLKDGRNQRGCVAFMIDDADQMSIQISLAHSGRKERFIASPVKDERCPTCYFSVPAIKPEMFVRTKGSEIAYQRLAEDPIYVPEELPYEVAVSYQIIKGIHISAIDKLDLKDFTNTTLAHIALNCAKELQILDYDWFITGKNKKKKTTCSCCG